MPGYHEAGQGRQIGGDGQWEDLGRPLADLWMLWQMASEAGAEEPHGLYI